MLACLQRRFGHREVQVVGRTDVDSADVGIGEQIFVIAGGSLNAQVIGELSRCLGGPSGNTDNFYIAETAQRFRMDAAHKTNPENSNLQLFHSSLQFFFTTAGGEQGLMFDGG
jgi:hypothetical protein